MPLVARASKYFCGKNLLLLLMCVGAMGWFAYDGWIGWPQRNDKIVQYVKDVMIPDGRVPASMGLDLAGWEGWDKSSVEERNRMTDVIKVAATKGDIEGWKSPTDINTQQYIVYGLILVVLWAAWRFIKFARARAIADETTLSPAPGIVIPWEKITVVDNTRWKSGLVKITWTDDKNESHEAVFDDYELDREKLLPILDMLAEKATKAEFKNAPE